MGNKNKFDAYEETLRKIIREEVVKALTVPITWHKVRDSKTGQPLATPELINEEVFLPSFFVQQLKYNEGAFRGMQADFGKERDRIGTLTNKVDAIGNVLVDMEYGLTIFHRFVGLLDGHLDRLGIEGRIGLPDDMKNVKDKNVEGKDNEGDA